MAIGCKKEVFRSDQIAGAWRIEEEGGYPIKAQSPDPATTVNLDSDGKLAATALPSGFIRMYGKPDQSVSGAGSWRIVHFDSDDADRVELRFTSFEGRNGQDVPYGAELFIEKSGSKLRLYYFVGDPDSDERVVFEREPVGR